MARDRLDSHPADVTFVLIIFLIIPCPLRPWKNKVKTSASRVDFVLTIRLFSSTSGGTFNEYRSRTDGIERRSAASEMTCFEKCRRVSRIQETERKRNIGEWRMASRSLAIFDRIISPKSNTRSQAKTSICKAENISRSCETAFTFTAKPPLYRFHTTIDNLPISINRRNFSLD